MPGVALNQWYSGYFDAFSRHGHGLYRELYGISGTVQPEPSELCDPPPE